MLQKFDPRNREILVNVNGELVHRDRAGVSPFDSSVQGGDAVWEGLRLYDGRIFRLRDHLDRLRSSAQALSFARFPTDERLIDELKRTLAANDMRDGVHIRLTVTRGLKVTSGMDPRLNEGEPTIIVLAEHKPPVYSRAGLTLLTARTRRIPPACLDQKIHSCNLLNSILAKIEANRAGADDALMLDTRGFLAETNATHVFVVANGAVRTSFTYSCPEGVTRRTVLELCAANEIPHGEADIAPDEIYRADEVFCTGTMGELAGVVEIDGQRIGHGEVGAMTHRLSELYAARTASEGFAILD